MKGKMSHFYSVAELKIFVRFTRFTYFPNLLSPFEVKRIKAVYGKETLIINSGKIYTTKSVMRKLKSERNKNKTFSMNSK